MDIETIKKGEILQVKSDILFHDLFNEHDMDTLEWVVMQILSCKHEDIHKKVSVSSIRLTNVNKYEKNKNVDLIVNLNDEKIIIELNNNYTGNYLRNLLYAFNVILNNYNIGDSYRRYEKDKIRVILVNLNWHRDKKGKKVIGKEVVDYKYPDEEIDDYLIRAININLDYYNEICYNEVGISDKLWKLLTIKDEEELEKLTEHEKLLENYQKKIVDLSQNIDYRREIMWSENIERNLQNMAIYDDGKAVGKAVGKEEGKQEKLLEMVLRMHAINLELEVIMKCTSLSKKEIMEIINNNKKG